MKASISLSESWYLKHISSNNMPIVSSVRNYQIKWVLAAAKTLQIIKGNKREEKKFLKFFDTENDRKGDCCKKNIVKII